MTKPIRLSDYRKRGKPQVTFDKYELRQLLNVYSRRVALGEWRDYAIDIKSGSAVFSIFRSTFDSPLFSIAKLSNGRHCNYLVFSGHQKVKHGKSIDEVLVVFDPKLHLISHSR